MLSDIILPMAVDHIISYGHVIRTNDDTRKYANAIGLGTPIAIHIPCVYMKHGMVA